MDKKKLKKNLPYILVIVAVLIGVIVSICNIKITGTTLEYNLNDKPDMKEVFSQALDETRALVFNGDNDGLKYIWTYDKEKVTDTKKTDLVIKSYSKFNKSIKKTLSTKKVLSFKYSKKIKLNGSPRLTFNNVSFGEKCYLFKLSNSRIKYVKDAVVSGDTVTFDVKDTKGIYFLASDIKTKTLKKIKKSTLAVKTSSLKEKEVLEKATKDKKDKKTYKAAKKAKAYVKKHSKIKKSKGKAINLSKQKVDKTVTLSCTLTVECKEILNHMDDLKEGKSKYVPSNGYIFSAKVTFYDGENVYDVLKREMQNHGIPFDATAYTKYASAYVKGINNLYEKDCGSTSGWTYYVNGQMPNFGCSRYVLSDGDKVVWRYTVEW